MLIEKLVVGTLQTNCYVVADDNGIAVVIDPGDDASLIEEALNNQGLTLTKILLTHGHPDHLFAAGQLQKNDDIELVMHEADVDQIEQNMDIAALFYDMSEYVPLKNRKYIKDGDIVEVGELEFKVIHTPGHTPGGVCYLTDAVLFAGDTLFSGSVGRTDLPGGSYADLVESIKNRLFALPDDTTVYPGHGGETTIGTEKMFNPFVG